MSKPKNDVTKSNTVTLQPKRVPQRKGTKATTQKSRTDSSPRKGKGASPAKPKGREGSKATVQQADRSKRGVFKDHPLQKISVLEAEKLARLDAPLQSTNATRYVKENTPTYWLLANVWLLQLAEVSEEGAYDVRDVMLRKGLIFVINECQKVASRLLTFGQTIEFALSPTDITAWATQTDETPLWLCGVISGCQNMQEVLQILRFPKRFSPSQADIIQEKGILDFLNVNNMCRLTRIRFAGQCACTRPDLIAKKLRYYILDMCRNFDVNYSRDGFFSSGVAADSGRPLAEKLNAYATFAPYLDTPLYPLGYGGTITPQQYGRRKKYDIFFSYVRAVPKSYKTPRIIAMEDAYRQFHMQAIRRALEKSLRENGYEKYLTLHDQSGNRDLCRTGSIDNRYSTIDLSSASDSLCRTLVGLIFPSKVWWEMNKYLPTHFKIEVNGRLETRKMHMFCTSGSALTFPIESMVFLAILLYAGDIAHLAYGEEMLPCRVFGDDMICDTRAFPIVLDILHRLGFVVNTEKSFSDNTQYRESCGVEYCGGYDTATKYFPRTTFDWKNPQSQLASLISLEKKFVSNWKIRRLLCDSIRLIFPDMTSSEVGSENPDLWEPIPVFKQSKAPVKEEKHEKGKTSPLPPTDSALRYVLEQAQIREAHYVEESTYGDNLNERLEPTGSTRLELVELWLYYSWLNTGPSFDSELDRILGVSSKPPKRESLSNVSKPKWVLKDF